MKWGARKGLFVSPPAFCFPAPRSAIKSLYLLRSLNLISSADMSLTSVSMLHNCLYCRVYIRTFFYGCRSRALRACDRGKVLKTKISQQLFLSKMRGAFIMRRKEMSNFACQCYGDVLITRVNMVSVAPFRKLQRAFLLL